MVEQIIDLPPSTSDWPGAQADCPETDFLVLDSGWVPPIAKGNWYIFRFKLGQSRCVGSTWFAWDILLMSVDVPKDNLFLFDVSLLLLEYGWDEEMVSADGNLIPAFYRLLTWYVDHRPGRDWQCCMSIIDAENFYHVSVYSARKNVDTLSWKKTWTAATLQ